ncbi:hypothetical protein SK128_009088 [Halocaridina rubra]|uniref:Hexosyltransferase n=1 Tax=Halocaridina rubra TaxID=373956 RepID=A0AAN8WQQ5_HALRR
MKPRNMLHKRSDQSSSISGPYKYLIEESDFCQRRQNLEIIAYVHSSISRVKKRNETRHTWAAVSSYNVGIFLGVIYVVGRAKNAYEDQIIRDESLQYHDIVQVDIEEDYHLLSYKSLAALSWIHLHCSEIPWTIHVDDDVVIDVFLLSLNLRDLNASDVEYFYCNIMYSNVMREGKWAVDPRDYSSEKYPAFCSGLMWFIPTRLIPRLLYASQEAPFLWIDDVYVTGILAEKANISLVDDPDGFGSQKINRKDIGRLMSWHAIKADRRQCWNDIVKHYRELFSATGPTNS